MNETITDLAKIEQTPAEQLAAPYVLKDFSSVEAEIVDLNDKLKVVGKVTLVIAFEIGKRLAAVKEALDHGEFGEWVEQNCPFSTRTAQKYMMVFARFKNEPDSFLENTGLREAYIEAGIVKVGAEEAPADAEKPQPAGEDEFEVAPDDFASIFRRKPRVPDLVLKKHRVVVMGSYVCMARKEYGRLLPMANLFILEKSAAPEVQEAFLKAGNDVACALELYCKSIEDLEDRGVLKAPVEQRMPQVIKKMSGLGPVAEEKQKRGRGRPAKER
jgi:hypothetical protein